MAEVQIVITDETLSGKAGKIVALTGQLDETNVDEEAKKIYAVIDEMAEPNILLDFANLTYINSKAIGYVTDWYSRTAAKNGKIVIARPQANILDILKVVGITQIISVYNSIDEAKAVFSGLNTPTNETETPVEPAPAPTPETSTPTPVVPETPVEPAPAPTPETSTPTPVVPETPVEPAPTPVAPPTTPLVTPVAPEVTPVTEPETPLTPASEPSPTETTETSAPVESTAPTEPAPETPPATPPVA